MRTVTIYGGRDRLMTLLQDALAEVGEGGEANIAVPGDGGANLLLKLRADFDPDAPVDDPEAPFVEYGEAYE